MKNSKYDESDFLNIFLRSREKQNERTETQKLQQYLKSHCFLSAEIAFVKF